MPRGGSRIPQSWGECLVQLPHLLSMGLKLRACGLQPMTTNKVTGWQEPPGTVSERWDQILMPCEAGTTLFPTIGEQTGAHRGQVA